jgi:hypothetical protein
MATPTPHDKREYEAFLRGPAAVNTFAFGTVDAYRSSVQHHGQLAVIPEPAENPLSDFGIQEGGGFTVVISDEVAGDGVLDWFLLMEGGAGYILAEDGSKIILEY